LQVTYKNRRQIRDKNQEGSELKPGEIENTESLEKKLRLFMQKRKQNILHIKLGLVVLILQ